MSLARWIICLATVSGARCYVVAPAAAQHPESTLEKVEHELHDAATTDPSHGNATTDPLSFDPDLAIFTFVVFVILLVVLQVCLGADHAGARTARAQHRRAHRRRPNGITSRPGNCWPTTSCGSPARPTKCRELLEEARRDAEAPSSKSWPKHGRAPRPKRTRALRDIESATDAALGIARKRSSQLAVDLAGKIVAAQLSKDDHARLIQDAVAKFPDDNCQQ